MKQIPSEFLTTPIVYAVKDTYQIFVPVTCETVMWVQVGERCFYDDCNGIFRSACSTHRMVVPMSLLDKEKKYTICYRIVHERKPYWSKTSDVMTYESCFRPVEKEPVHIYHLADAHAYVEEPIAAAQYFGDQLDLLILNGDIPDHSGTVEDFKNVHLIASSVTGGEIPVVFARGNHDTRGAAAELLPDHTPTDCGRSYFTFRLGHVWGVVMDTAEDKRDDCEEYGGVVCSHDFRLRETEFLKEVIENCREEYEAEGVKNRIVVCHLPFTMDFPPPFDIEDEIFREWCRLLREYIKPQVMFCGHRHLLYVSDVGSERDNKGQPCPVVVGSRSVVISMRRRLTEKYPFWGGAYTLSPNSCHVIFNSNQGDTEQEQTLEF